MPSTCPFCQITLPLFQSSLALAFLDISPIRPGHALVIPRRHEPDFWNLTDSEHSEMLSLARQLATAQKQLYHPPRVGLIVAGFDVPHAHLHIIPMHTTTDITSESILNGTRQRATATELSARHQEYLTHFQSLPDRVTHPK